MKKIKKKSKKIVAKIREYLAQIIVAIIIVWLTNKLGF